MVGEQEDVFFYMTLMNENYRHPAMPDGAEDGILRGMYRLVVVGRAAPGAAAGLGDDPERGDRGGRCSRRTGASPRTSGA